VVGCMSEFQFLVVCGAPDSNNPQLTTSND
jgi:hypothetical protein